MKNKKLLFGALLFTAVGVAAVSTNLIMNMSTKISPNTDDYDVYFSQAKVNGVVDNSVIIVDAKGDDRYTEGKLYYLSIGETELKEFTCEEGYESVTAFISDNAKYILTTHPFSDFEAEIKLYDVKSGEVLLNKKVSNNALTAYIDENIRKLYVVCGTEFSVFDF